MVVAAVFAGASWLYARRSVARIQTTHDADTERRLDQARITEQQAQSVLLAAKEEAARRRDEAEAEVRERRAEVARLEQRTNQREEGLERRLRELDSNEQRLTRREAELEALRQTVEDERASITQELARVAALSEQEARAEVIHSVEGELVPEIAERIRQAEVEVREQAAAQSREILIAAMQRQASEQSGEASVTVVALPSDELKGRIIGREGRNIRALEAATGVDVIVDDTPEAIVISARSTRCAARSPKRPSSALSATGASIPPASRRWSGRPATSWRSRSSDEGEQACQDIGLTNVHPELARLLGTLRFRNSYGHNVLAHSQDTAAIAGMIAAEIGFDDQVAKEAALFHDIGKAVEHDVDGPHAIIGGEILARLGRPAAVVQAVRSHHYDEEPRSPAAAILMTADAISASRPGARRESLASTIKRLERIEAIANEFHGVDRSFAVLAGKELRVLVKPDEISDDEAQIMARQIAKRLHGEGSYSGRVKVVVLRETRSVEYAK